MSVFIYSVWLPFYIFNYIIIDEGSLIINVETTFDRHCRWLVLPAGLCLFGFKIWRERNRCAGKPHRRGKYVGPYYNGHKPRTQSSFLSWAES